MCNPIMLHDSQKVQITQTGQSQLVLTDDWSQAFIMDLDMFLPAYKIQRRQGGDRLEQFSRYTVFLSHTLYSYHST